MIRKCEALEEMQACFALQKEVWKFSDAELVPVRMFVLANKIGGHVIGAFERDNLIGFALAIPGMRNGRSYIHSHMLAVRQQYRNGGLGWRLKLAQRDEALACGYELMEWTFDPLEIKNAYLNIEKLGAIARRYAQRASVPRSPPTRRCAARRRRGAARPDAPDMDAVCAQPERLREGHSARSARTRTVVAGNR